MVGKVTPKGDLHLVLKKSLLRSIFGEKAIDVTDTSLKMPSGSGGIVVDVRVFNRHGIEKDERSITIERSEIESVQQDKIVEEEILERSIKNSALSIFTGLTINKKIQKSLNIGDKIDENNIHQIPISDLFKLSLDDKNKLDAVVKLKDQYNQAKKDIQDRFEDKVLKIRQGDDLLTKCNENGKSFCCY